MSVKLTYTEVSAHCKPNDYYVVVHDKIYDLSKFIDEHPGGEEVMKDVAGKDATEAYEDVGHSTDALKILATLRIGDLKKEVGGSKKKGKTTQSFPTAPKQSSFNVYATIILSLVFGLYVAYRIKY